jgi:hypothetical protein
MNPPPLPGSALLAKTNAFFALGLLTMQPIPDDRADKTEDVSNHGSHHHERNCSQQIELFDEVNRLDHVRPENEVGDWLRPGNQNQKRPDQMPSAEQCADHKPDLIGINQSYP